MSRRWGRSDLNKIRENLNSLTCVISSIKERCQVNLLDSH